jgi:hypothetical protein
LHRTCPLLAQSGHAELHRTRLLLTQSGHPFTSNDISV